MKILEDSDDSKVGGIQGHSDSCYFPKGNLENMQDFRSSPACVTSSMHRSEVALADKGSKADTLKVLLLHFHQPHMASGGPGVLRVWWSTCRSAWALRELLDWQRHGIQTCCRICGFLDQKKIVRVTHFRHQWQHKFPWIQVKSDAPPCTPRHSEQRIQRMPGRQWDPCPPKMRPPASTSQGDIRPSSYTWQDTVLGAREKEKIWRMSIYLKENATQKRSLRSERSSCNFKIPPFCHPYPTLYLHPKR